MTVQELKTFILQNMTAEEALDKFIKTSIDHYEQLKTDPKFEGNPLFIMIAAAWDLGWDVATEKEDEVRGIVLGTHDYMLTLFPDQPEQIES
jgi:hypothetical protein